MFYGPCRSPLLTMRVSQPDDLGQEAILIIFQCPALLLSCRASGFHGNTVVSPGLYLQSNKTRDLLLTCQKTSNSRILSPRCEFVALSSREPHPRHQLLFVAAALGSPAERQPADLQLAAALHRGAGRTLVACRHCNSATAIHLTMRGT